jgi:hypothetical protein
VRQAGLGIAQPPTRKRWSSISNHSEPQTVIFPMTNHRYGCCSRNLSIEVMRQCGCSPDILSLLRCCWRNAWPKWGMRPSIIKFCEAMWNENHGKPATPIPPEILRSDGFHTTPNIHNAPSFMVAMGPIATDICCFETSKKPRSFEVEGVPSRMSATERDFALGADAQDLARWERAPWVFQMDMEFLPGPYARFVILRFWNTSSVDR